MKTHPMNAEELLSLSWGSSGSNRIKSEPVSAWVTSECDKSIEHPAFWGPHIAPLKLGKPLKCGMLDGLAGTQRSPGSSGIQRDGVKISVF